MGSTALRKIGVRPERMTDRMRHFANEYVVHHDNKRAALAAGYSGKSVSVRACKLLNNPTVASYIGKLEQESRDKYILTSEEVIKRLGQLVCRDVLGFGDKNGFITDKLSNLPPELRIAINGFKARKYTSEDGTVVQEIEVKLAPIEVCMDMILKHKGLFAPQQHVHSLAPLDLEALYRDARNDPDPIEARILDVETKSIALNSSKNFEASDSHKD